MPTPSLRIAIIHLGFYYSGGGEKLVLEEMRGLKAAGHSVDCYAPYVDREQCYPDMPEIRQVRAMLPAPPVWLPMKDPLWVLLACLLVPFMAPRFCRYDILMGANQPGPWLAYVLSRILRKPYVIYLAQPLRILHPRAVDLENGIRIREGDARFISALTKLASRLIDWADRISVTNAHIVLTNGDHVSHWISEVYGIDNRVCAAGCHPIVERELNYAIRWSGQLGVNGWRIPKPYILLTNRHSPMKRFEYAIWSLKAIVRSAPHICLVITGQETEYTDQLRYLVNGLGLSKSVHFIGLVSEADLHRLYSNAAVYVYPSPEEDFGMGIVEAMASGTPVVAWCNGGPTVTIVDRETGYLVAPYDTDAFAHRLEQLATSRSLAERMGRAGHRRALQHFSYSRHNEVLADVLLSAVAGLAVRAVVDEMPRADPVLVKK